MTFVDSDGKGPRKLGLTAQYPGRQRRRYFSSNKTTQKNPNSAKKQKRSLSVITSRKYLQNPPYKLNYVQCKHFEARSENGNEKLKCS